MNEKGGGGFYLSNPYYNRNDQKFAVDDVPSDYDNHSREKYDSGKRGDSNVF